MAFAPAGPSLTGGGSFCCRKGVEVPVLGRIVNGGVERGVQASLESLDETQSWAGQLGSCKPLNLHWFD
jgi:hypothetical protein